MTYAIRDLVERYRVTEQTVLKWIANGELKAVNVGVEPGKKKPRWRITQEALDEFEAVRGSAPQQPKRQRRRRRPQKVAVDLGKFK